ncbi:MFS transporter [Mongoliitalea daihaiensis]|uniref:MFS transporter n=1 Tax=Mongoliitalea daihaiensis TaxID=2782006 RepID=UPI001F487B8E|nr:MFS transporter [Mongoliitalea daihaiensis]UJP64491.1 MFS transporter [Mongoliitalea daihaiensis]
MNRILTLIVVAQFLATSLWFAGNAVIVELSAARSFPADFIGHLTSSVQLGFICGTLAFAIFMISDRFSPSKVFLFSALFAALLNACVAFFEIGLWAVLSLRFSTGFFLAGIYPVGMKIASDYFDKGLGKSLGLLVGALVLGTAFPHLLRSLLQEFPWQWVLYTSSAFAVLGGLLIGLRVPDGPYRKASSAIDFKILFKLFQVPNFRAAAMGYFGHMWELYTFWAFIPMMLTAYIVKHQTTADISFISFAVIGIGGLSCAAAGLFSNVIHPKKIAQLALACSGICCLLSPFFFFQSSLPILIVFLLIWGIAVTADSPMFSTLVAQSAPAASKGTALTIVNSLGFGITVISLQLTQLLALHITGIYWLLLLGLGPVIGLMTFSSFRK